MCYLNTGLLDEHETHLSKVHPYIYPSIHPSIHIWLYSPFFDLGRFFSFLDLYTQAIGLLGQEISPLQGRYIHTEQHKHRINAHTNSHSLSGIATHDPSVWTSEDISCLRPRDHCDRHIHICFLLTSIVFRKNSKINCGVGTLQYHQSPRQNSVPHRSRSGVHLPKKLKIAVGKTKTLWKLGVWENRSRC
jgi:hypothetical protein